MSAEKGKWMMNNDDDLFCPLHRSHGPAEDEVCEACDSYLFAFVDEIEEAIRRSKTSEAMTLWSEEAVFRAEAHRFVTMVNGKPRMVH